MSLSPGERFGPFTVERLLGEGGMASVYLVHDDQARPRALKVLHRGTSQAARARLLAEGRVQSALDHPNVVAVRQILDEEGQLGLILDYVDGPSLKELLAAGPVDVDRADALAVGILAGVEAAHAAGTVHRDIKPYNILLAKVDGALQPRIADFGIVKVLDTDAEGLEFLTRTGFAMGTPSYMAPEQIRSARQVDGRADLFAVGAVLYEVVTGRRAFSGEDIYATWSAIQRGDYVDPTQLVPELPARMASAIAAALIPDPKRRVGSAAALRDLWLGVTAWTPPAPPEDEEGNTLPELWMSAEVPLHHATLDPTDEVAPAVQQAQLPAPIPAPPVPTLAQAIHLLADHLLACSWSASGEARADGYVELEAEVERAPLWGRLAWLPLARRVDWHHEGALSRALLRLRDPFAVLIGPAGSGKSMALRAAARALLDRATTARDPVTLPLYVPLQRLQLDDGDPVGAARRFLAEALATRGLPPPWVDGWDPRIRWVVLLDGLDEVPGILSSTWRDERVQAHLDALHRAVVAIPGARGVVSTRPLRGQGRFRWPQVRVLPLTLERAHAFLEAGLPSQALVDEGARWLAGGSRTERAAGQNPLLLTLLTGFAAHHARMPDNLYDLFADIVARRLASAAADVPSEQVDAHVALRVASMLGFAMADDHRLGLELTLTQALDAVRVRDPLLSSRVPASLSLLAHAGLGRLRGDTPGHTVFGFAHRRLQEYFAAEALRIGELDDPPDLLDDYRWRETAVMVLQTRDIGAIAPWIDEARDRLETSRARLEEQGSPRELTVASSRWRTEVHPMLHLLGILQDGLGDRLGEVPGSLREDAGAWIARVLAAGGPIERHQLLEVVGIAPEAVQREALHQALRHRSLWSLERALQQASWMREADERLQEEFRHFLLWQALSGELTQRQAALKTWLARLPNPEPLLDTLRLLRWAPWIDRALVVAVCLVIGLSVAPTVPLGLLAGAVLTILGVGTLPVERRFLGFQVDAMARQFGTAHPAAPLYLVVIRVSLMGLAYLWTAIAFDAELTWRIPAALSLVVTWLPAAWAVATTRRFARPPWWPILPIVAPVALAQEPRVRQTARQNLFMLAVAAAYGVVYATLYDAGGRTFQLATLVFVAVMVAPTVVSLALDWRIVRALRAERGGLTTRTFLLELGRYRTAWGRRRFLEEVRERQLLVADDEARSALAHLARRLDPLIEENRLALSRDTWKTRIRLLISIRPYKMIQALAPMTEGTVDALVEARSNRGDWEPAVLDALYRLHESLGPGGSES